MLAISLDAARNIGIALVAVFLAGSVASAWIMKTIMQKLAVAAVMAVLAFAVWSQRDSLQECADKVKDDFDLARQSEDLSVADIDTECSFFETTIRIKDPRRDDTE